MRLGLRRSVSCTGSCLDNAVAEIWFASLHSTVVTCGYRVETADRHDQPATIDHGRTTRIHFLGEVFSFIEAHRSVWRLARSSHGMLAIG